MKKYLLGLLFCSSTAFSLEPEVVEDYKAVFYVNKSAMVCGTVAQVKSANKQTYINVGGVYPKQKITFLVWNDDLPAFNQKFGNLKTLGKKRVCARGVITDYKGKLQIITKDPNFLRLIMD